MTLIDKSAESAEIVQNDYIDGKDDYVKRKDEPQTDLNGPERTKTDKPVYERRE